MIILSLVKKYPAIMWKEQFYIVNCRLNIILPIDDGGGLPPNRVDPF